VTWTVTELAEALEVKEAWELEVTALLSHLGAVTLPPAVLAELDAGRPLTEEDVDMVGRIPEISRDLVAPTPGLEGVAQAIDWHLARYGPPCRRRSVLFAPTPARTTPVCSLRW
jgi:response regulator RpfG family c-di-GMP phosphodiesterase